MRPPDLFAIRPNSPISIIGLPGVVLLVLFVSGCNSHAPTAQVAKARRFLQINRPQAAVDALVREDSAEGHYLKAIALQSLGERVAARDQIGEALSIAPEEPKYLGYEALIDMSMGKPEGADRLIELFNMRPSSPAIAFFATRAYVSKSDVRGAIRSFKLGLTLIDDIPEFMFNALQYAVVTQQPAVAKQLIGKLEKAAPDDAEFLRELLSISMKAKLQEPSEHLLERLMALAPDLPELPELRVRMELLAGRYESALTQVRKVVADHSNQTEAELLLAEVLVKANPKPEREKELAALSAKHPENPEFLRRYTLYLVKDNRLAEAVKIVNAAATTSKVAPIRAALMNTAIRLPLDEGNAKLAEEQLKLHSAQIGSPLVSEYFKARILFLKHDFAGALEHFHNVTASPESQTSDAGRSLAAECMDWQQQIVGMQTANAKLKAAQEELKKLTSPRKVPDSAAIKKKPS